MKPRIFKKRIILQKFKIGDRIIIIKNDGIHIRRGYRGIIGSIAVQLGLVYVNNVGWLNIKQIKKYNE